jgi:hypothetical protein
MLNEVGRHRRREAYETEVGGGYSRAEFAPCQPPERAEADRDGSLEWRSFKQLSTFAR